MSNMSLDGWMRLGIGPNLSLDPAPDTELCDEPFLLPTTAEFINALG